MKKISFFLGVFAMSLINAQQYPPELHKELSQIKGVWKTEVDGSPITLNITSTTEQKEEVFKFSLINVDKNEFSIKESQISKFNESEYEIKVIKADFTDYNNCSIKNSKIVLKKLSNDQLVFTYTSDGTSCSRGASGGFDLPNIENVIFNK